MFKTKIKHVPKFDLQRVYSSSKCCPKIDATILVVLAA